MEQERIKHEITGAEATITQWTVELEVIIRAFDEALSLLEDP
jgi:hypothetical protein